MSQTHPCDICSRPFTQSFAYQREERAGADGAQPRVLHFCSQQCLAQSHADASGCDACGARFTVELAAHVVFHAGRRHYACGPACRAQLLGEPAPLRLVASNRAPERRPEPPPSARTRAHVLAVFNHKGGTGKTTTSVTLAAALAARGHRVLLVDTDGQGNVAVSLGLSVERSLYHVLVMGLDIEQAVTLARPNLWVLPANETLAAAELYLAGRKQRDRVLASRLARARELYDFVIVDCSPSLSLLNQNALCFADSVLCPVACDYLSLVGVRQVLRTIKHVNKLLGHPVRLFGVLPTLFDSRARICHEALGAMREHFGERCLDPIRLTSKVKEAPAQGRTLLEHASGSSAAVDYERVVERLLADSVEFEALFAVGAGGVV